jgi:hypothetical protein
MTADLGDDTLAPDNWEDRARPLLQKYSLDEEEVTCQVIVDWLRPAGIKTCIRLYRSLPANQQRKVPDLAKDLAINRSTVYRLFDKNAKPDGLTLMAVLINLVGADPPVKLRDVVFGTAAEVMRRIREEIFDETPEQLAPIESAALHYFMRSEKSVGVDTSDPEELLADLDTEQDVPRTGIMPAIVDVIRELRMQYPDERHKPQQLIASILYWRPAYLLFRFAIDEKPWDFFHEQ